MENQRFDSAKRAEPSSLELCRGAKTCLEKERLTEGQIILYQPNSTVRIEVRLEDDTVWLTQAQLIELFDSSKPNISEHLKNIFTSGELDKTATVRKNRTVQIEGNRNVSRLLEYYNLDVIISVGYRVNTVRGIKFRQWATKILKEYLLRGHAINSRIDRIEKTVAIQGEKIDFLIQTALPPSEGIFFEGQIFDAYSLICDLLRTAKERVILVDNYIDDTVLRQLDKRPERVTATIYTMTIGKTLQQDLERHNAQYAPIEIKTLHKVHDRFLMIDDTVYHVGASFKDLGKKLCAFSKMKLMSTNEILNRLNV